MNNLGRGYLARHTARQRTTRRIKGFWRCISRCSCRESKPKSSRGRQKTQDAPQCYRLNTSQSWEVTLGVIGQHWEGSAGQGWEGEVTFLRKVPAHAHKGKMVDNVYSSTWGRGMSAGAFKQRCTKTINRHGTHT